MHSLTLAHRHYTHHTLMPIVWAPAFATTPPVRSPAKASAILNEFVTAEVLLVAM